ncbi:MAG TPA: hypothetical protein VMW84_01545 [Acidobacteriota bacterium]|nr:hypothetical protein [Acidobacteriota bacterium]
MKITHEMIEAAMKKAVELGVFPKKVDEETYFQNWANMDEILEAALEA